MPEPALPKPEQQAIVAPSRPLPELVLRTQMCRCKYWRNCFIDCGRTR